MTDKLTGSGAVVKDLERCSWETQSMGRDFIEEGKGKGI